MKHGEKATIMTTRNASRLAAAALAALGALAASNCADQRPPECTVPASTNFAVRLVEQPGTAAGACDGVEPLRGGVFGLRPHPVAGADGYPDYDIPFNVSFQFQDIGALRDAAEARLAALDLPPLPPPAEVAYNFGPYTTSSPVDDICSLPSTEPARLVLPEIPGIPEVPADPGDPATEEDDVPGVPARPPLPAVDITAVWSDVRVLVTTAYQGVQFRGTFTYTFNGCTRVYQGTGVWGSFNVTCEGADEEGAPNGQPDDALCRSAPSTANITGSGINPDFPVSCDPATLLCLLDGEFPSYRQ